MYIQIKNTEHGPYRVPSVASNGLIIMVMHADHGLLCMQITDQPGSNLQWSSHISVADGPHMVLYIACCGPIMVCCTRTLDGPISCHSNPVSSVLHMDHWCIGYIAFAHGPLVYWSHRLCIWTGLVSSSTCPAVLYIAYNGPITLKFMWTMDVPISCVHWSHHMHVDLFGPISNFQWSYHTTVSHGPGWSHQFLSMVL